MKIGWLGLSLSLGTAAAIALPLNTQAVELGDGTTAFLQPPQFLNARTTNDFVMRRNATYFFTLDLPTDADAPLQTVVISPQNLTRHLQPYRLDQTVAFSGTPRDAQSELSLGNVAIDEDTKAVTVEFDPPVAPGQLVTIGLRPRRNPRLDGIYVFRVTAIPEGEQPRPHIAGHGRLYFSDIERDRIYR